MTRRIRCHVFAVLLLVPGAFVLAQETKPAPDTAPSDKTPDADTFVVSVLPSDIGFNPLTSYTTSEAQVFSGIYEGLVTYDPYSLDPVPAVASRWEVSDDGKTYRFFLRPDARYSNGDPVLASDFRDTWLMLLDPATNAAYASLFDIVAGARAYRTGKNHDPQSVGIRVISDHVLEVELEQRATHFLRILCHHSFSPVHPSVRASGDWSDPTTMPVDGPYTVTVMNDKEIVLSSNPDYWDAGRIDYKEIRIEQNEDAAAVTAAFNAGKIDWVHSGIDLGSVARSDDIVINPLFATTYYQLSATVKPFDDPRVRRAMALLLPWDRIRSTDYWYVPASTLVPELPSYPTADGITSEDRDEAMKLLADAGYPDGKGMPPIVISIPTALDDDVVAQIMVQSWKDELGIDVETNVVPYPRYFSFVERRSFMVSTISWIGDFADPLTFLDMWTTGSNLNNSGYSNPEYDALIKQAMGMTGSERYETLSKAESLLLEDGIVMPISHSPSINLINLDLFDGWYPNPLDIHPFKFLTPATGKPLLNVASLP